MRNSALDACHEPGAGEYLKQGLLSPVSYKPSPLPRAGSALTQTALMSDSCPVNVCRHMLSRMSHSLTEASQAPETKQRMSGESERDMTSPLWPVKVVVCWPVSMSHRALARRKGRQSGMHPTRLQDSRFDHSLVLMSILTTPTWNRQMALKQRPSTYWALRVRFRGEVFPANWKGLWFCALPASLVCVARCRSTDPGLGTPALESLFWSSWSEITLGHCSAPAV